MKRRGKCDLLLLQIGCSAGLKRSVEPLWMILRIAKDCLDERLCSSVLCTQIQSVPYAHLSRSVHAGMHHFLTFTTGKRMARDGWTRPWRLLRSDEGTQYSTTFLVSTTFYEWPDADVEARIHKDSVTARLHRDSQILCSVLGSGFYTAFRAFHLPAP